MQRPLLTVGITVRRLTYSHYRISNLSTHPRSTPSPAIKMDEAAEHIQENIEAHTNKGKGRAPRGPKTRGGHGGGGNRDVQLSKALSKLLRHQAQTAGIQLDREGFAALDRVLSWGPIKSLKPTFEEIQSAVKDSDKQRFALKPKDPANDESMQPEDWLIRANQGHSIKVESEALLRPIAILSSDEAEDKSTTGEDGETKGPVPVPKTVVHGTYFAFWPTIVESGGLRVMRRTHVHCSVGLPEDGKEVISGMRRDAELLVHIDVEKSIREAGMKWWMSENGVVLTEGIEEDGVAGLVPARFFREVVGRKKDVGVLWRDGEKVGDLPADLKVVVPMGKGGRGGRGGRRGR